MSMLPQKPVKILCISVSTGAGHKRAAEAITSEANAMGLEATHIDMMDHVSAAYKTAYVRAYSLIVKQAPQVWGFLYNSTNKDVTSPFTTLSKRLSHINTSALFEYIKKYAPTHIIATHYLPTHTLSSDRASFLKHVPISLVLTDYDNHSIFISEEVDQFFVATKKMRFKFIESGIDPKKVIVSGIPVASKFYESYDMTSIRQIHHIDQHAKVILALSGGEGLTDLTKVVETLFRLKEKAVIIAVAGKNTALQEKLSTLTPPSHIQYRHFGWTDELDTYLKIADVVITKPGGLTTSECLALKKPIIAVQPIPGQEEHNTEFILEHGYGVVARSLSDILFYLEEESTFLRKGRAGEMLSQPATKTILSSLL